MFSIKAGLNVSRMELFITGSLHFAALGWIQTIQLETNDAI